MKTSKIVQEPPAPPAETTHASHPGHTLRLVTTDDVKFTCDGCLERGAGARYTCEQHNGKDEPCCNFDLHTWCALAPDILEHHTLLEGCCARLPGRIALDGVDFELSDKPAPYRCCEVHKEHKLKLVEQGNATPFQCNGCKERGAGARYISACPSAGNLVFHIDCALAEPTLEHPLLKKSKFELCHVPPAPTGDEAKLCNACGGKVLGFYYHDTKGDKDLHPCCAKLPLAIHLGELKFELRKKVSHRCSRCRKMDGFYRFWFYRSTCKTVYLHVKCMKEMACPSGGAGGSGGADDDRVITFVKEDALKSYRGKKTGSRSKFERICVLVATAVRIIIAVLIGDPTPIIVAGVSALIQSIL